MSFPVEYQVTPLEYGHCVLEAAYKPSRQAIVVILVVVVVDMKPNVLVQQFSLECVGMSSVVISA